MANQDWAFGLQPVRSVHGDAPETMHFPLLLNTTTGYAKYTTKIYKGQIVAWQGTAGYLIANAATNPLANLIGVAAEYYKGAGTTKTQLAVWPIRPGSQWLIQSDGGTTSTNRASYLMKQSVVVNQAAGNTNTGLSGMEWDFSERGNTAGDAANPLKCVGFRLKPGDTVAGANVNLVVEFITGAGFGSEVTTT